MWRISVFFNCFFAKFLTYSTFKNSIVSSGIKNTFNAARHASILSINKRVKPSKKQLPASCHFNCLAISDMEDCAPGTSVPDFQSILWSASGTPIQFLAIFYYEERMKIQNPFFKKDLKRERNPFKRIFHMTGSYILKLKSFKDRTWPNSKTGWPVDRIARCSFFLLETYVLAPYSNICLVIVIGQTYSLSAVRVRLDFFEDKLTS